MSRSAYIGLVVLGGLALSVATVGPAQGQAPAGRKFALLVGVRQYQTPALRPLNYADRDVEELATVLAEIGYDKDDVRVLTQERAARELRALPTSHNIRTELGRLLKLLELRDNPADALVVALAGHGIMDPKSQSSYFCPADVGAQDLSPEDPALIDLGKLYDELQKSRAGFKLLLVDACRNDPLNPRRAVRPVVDLVSVTRPLKKRPPGGVAALFSCSEGQVAYEDDGLKHGVFFHFVIEGLRGKADADGDGKLMLGELASYTSTEVFQFVDRTRNDEQVPEYVFKANQVSLVERARGPRPITNTVGMTLVPIPAGEFLMGSPDSDRDADADEKPRHPVRITRPFYLGATEVTVGQFRRVAESAGLRTEAERDGQGGYGWNEQSKKFEGRDPKYSWKFTGFPQADGHPVVNVSWNDAVAFCNALSELDGLKPYYRFGAGAQSGGEGYRLPTEAEWGYACRGGTTTRYQGGDDPETLALVGNVADATAKERYPDWTTTAARDGHVYTAPVGHFRGNGFGLYDMHGNVWEWCWDGFQADYYKGSPGADPSGPLQATDRVYRGGSWNDDPRFARSANRNGNAPEDRNLNLGFRVARVRSGR